MKKIHALVCMSAALFVTPLVAACGSNADTAPVPEAEEIVSPVLPSAPETQLPETPVVPPTSATQTPVTPEAKPAAAKYVCTTADGLNVRTGAGTQYATLGKAEKNILVKYAGKKGDWYETRYRGKTAYVSASYTKLVELETGTDKAEAVVEEGLKLLGTPYVYGATRLHDGRGNKLAGFTTQKFDCSSLMQYIFYRGADVLLDVTTRTQVLQGKPADHIRRGDLLFFTNASRRNKTGIERVGHVALYLGDNYILHTASDYAKIEQISAARWRDFICARRVI